MRSTGVVIFIGFLFTSVSFAAPPPATLTYQGRILKIDGTPVTGSIPFRVQIYSPSPSNCLMYSEDRTVVIPADAKGAFAFEINGGARTRTDGGTYEFEEIFLNRGTFTYPASDCGVVNTFTPDATTTRNIIVSFYESSAWEVLPSMNTAFVPQSLESAHVGGYGADDLLRVDRTSTSQTVNAFSFADYGKLVELIAGKLDGKPLPALSNGQVLGKNASGDWQAITPLTSATLPACAANEYLQVSSGSLICATVTGGGGSGSVTSVAVSVPSYMTSGGGPITSSGTIALDFASQAASSVFAGPTSGTGAPAFRTLNIADIKSSVSGNFFAASGACPAGQTLTYTAVSDSVTCAPYSLTSSQITTALGFTPVNKNGDTMTGALNLPAGGLAVGSSELVVNSGNVGVGPTFPGNETDPEDQSARSFGTSVM